MKIVHISDIHWRGIARHEEYTDSFERLFDLLRRRIKPDLIINTGDTFHTKTQGITPEIIEKLSWMFRELGNIAPTVSILGNHDGNLTNSDRQDIISPIHEAINHSNTFLFKKSVSVPLCDLKMKGSILTGQDAEVYLHIYSPFDTDGWTNIKPLDGKVNIALFHGSILGCQTDSNFRMTSTERDVKFFTGMDFVLLGDIHKHQFLAHRVDKTGTPKPWVGYPGSLIQQNFGETENKGFCVWDINAKDDWDVKFVDLENRAPFITVPWTGTVGSTIKNIEKTRGGVVYPGTRIRVSSSQPIQQVEARQLFSELKEHRKASEVIFKYDLISNMETIESSNGKILKTNLRSDPDSLIKFYRDFIAAHGGTYNFTDDLLFQSETAIRHYLNQLNSDDTDQITRNVTWSLKSLEFDNIFRYGEGNVVNFENMEGVVGVFGPNKIGKSSIVGAIMYALFNTTDRGPMKSAHIINKNKKRCWAKVRLSIGGVEYIIERETVRNSPKRNPKKEDADKTLTALNLYKVDPDGNLVEMNSITRDDTDKEIRKLIGTPQDFLLTAFSTQGGINRFIEEGATARKAILSRFLDLDIFEKLHCYAKDDFALINDKTKKYSNFDWGSALNRGVSEVEVLELQADGLIKKIAENVKRRDDLKLWIMQHDKENENVSTQKYLQTKKALELSENKLLKLLKEEDMAKVECRKAESLLLQLQEEKKKFDLSSLMEKLEKIEESKSKVSLIKETYAKENSIFEQQKKSVKKLELVPCGDQFPTCRFIKDSHEDKKKVQKQEESVQQLSDSLLVLEKVLTDYAMERIGDQIQELQKIEKREVQSQSAISSYKNILELAKRDIADIRIHIATSEKELASLTEKLASVERKEVEKNRMLLDVLSEDIEIIERQNRDTLVKLGGKNEQLKQLTKERAECKADLEKLKIFESIQNAFSKNGIPAMVLKTQLPAINFELSKILDNIVDFKVTLETDITSNVMDVYIEDGHSRRIIELASGMEKMICSLALRVALINLSSLSRPDILIIDEGFGALDEDSTIRCMELLSVLKSYFKTILVITHVNPIKEVADRIIEVRNDGIESKVEA
ncbi:MAG: metallophosphoesterase [Candidatus Paceibacterota bacterium]|jgi:DNA repair exonuclease SbcCD ATPase subunit